MAPKPPKTSIDYDAIDRQARSPSHQLRMNNMLGGTDAPPKPATTAPPSGFVDYLKSLGSDAANAFSRGLSTVQNATDRAIKSSPSLNKIKTFFGDFGNALSTGVSNSPTVPQAFDKAKELPAILRDAQMSSQR